jgi:hypothetical protein
VISSPEAFYSLSRLSRLNRAEESWKKLYELSNHADVGGRVVIKYVMFGVLLSIFGELLKFGNIRVCRAIFLESLDQVSYVDDIAAIHNANEDFEEDPSTHAPASTKMNIRTGIVFPTTASALRALAALKELMAISNAPPIPVSSTNATTPLASHPPAPPAPAPTWPRSATAIPIPPQPMLKSGSLPSANSPTSYLLLCLLCGIPYQQILPACPHCSTARQPSKSEASLRPFLSLLSTSVSSTETGNLPAGSLSTKPLPHLPVGGGYFSNLAHANAAAAGVRRTPPVNPPFIDISDDDDDGPSRSPALPSSQSTPAIPSMCIEIDDDDDGAQTERSSVKREAVTAPTPAPAKRHQS